MRRLQGLAKNNGQAKRFFHRPPPVAARFDPLGHRRPLRQLLGHVHLRNFAETFVDGQNVRMVEGFERTKDLFETFDKRSSGHDLIQSGSEPDRHVQAPVVGIIQIEESFMKSQAPDFVPPGNNPGRQGTHGRTTAARSARRHERILSLLHMTNGPAKAGVPSASIYAIVGFPRLRGNVKETGAGFVEFGRFWGFRNSQGPVGQEAGLTNEVSPPINEGWTRV
jgi:hypothetical protein